MKVNENEILNNLLIKQTEFSLVDNENATTIRHHCQQLMCFLFIRCTIKARHKKNDSMQESQRIRWNKIMGKKEKEIELCFCVSYYLNKKIQF